jgi:hypothetical protein
VLACSGVQVNTDFTSDYFMRSSRLLVDEEEHRELRGSPTHSFSSSSPRSGSVNNLAYVVT